MVARTWRESLFSLLKGVEHAALARLFPAEMVIVLFLVLLAAPSFHLFYVYSLFLLDCGRNTLFDLLSRPLAVIHALLLNSYRLNGLLDHLRDEVTLIIILRQVDFFPLIFLLFLHVLIF